MNHGAFVISLDFELAWGVRDSVNPGSYDHHLRGVHEVLPRLLDLFSRYEVHSTFAVVGFLFFHDKKELQQHLPSHPPSYLRAHLSPYTSYIPQLDDEPYSRDLHFAPGMIDRLAKTRGVEIATHTYSHYYCLEAGQTPEQFSEDLERAIRIAGNRNIAISSLVFPRNQFNKSYLDICAAKGITCYRGNESSWLHPGDHSDNGSYFRRFARLIDSYINFTGHHVTPLAYIESAPIVNLPASRFLRPHSPWLSALDPLKLKRIKSSMSFAAQTNSLFHRQ